MVNQNNIDLTGEVLHADPYLNTTEYCKDGIEKAQFICEYELWYEIAAFTEKAFLLRREDVDELWLAISFPSIRRPQTVKQDVISDCSDEVHASTDFKCAYVVRRSGNEYEAARRLLQRLFRDRSLYGWPEKLQASGLVDEAEFQNLAKELENEFNAIRTENQLLESAIVMLARELQLSPEPSSTERNRWTARCPETNHHLYIDPSKNLFMCGWCKQGGGNEDLRNFVQHKRDVKRHG